MGTHHHIVLLQLLLRGVKLLNMTARPILYLIFLQVQVILPTLRDNADYDNA